MAPMDGDPLQFNAAWFNHPREPTGSSVVEPDSVTTEDGRSYHGYHEGKYLLPNDADEQDRLDFQHQMTTVILEGRLAVAPVGNPRRVLDLATGTGLWALEWAREHPDAHVVGTDLSKIQPDLEDEVPNCTFIKEDAEDPWVFDDKFDYIHLRYVVTCFNDHKAVMRQAFENLNPGGWIEYVDQTCEPYRWGGTAEGTVWGDFTNAFVASMAKLGRDVQVPRRYQGWLEEVGFVDVRREVLPLPMNDWPGHPALKLAGRYNLVNTRTGSLDVAKPLFVRTGMDPREYDVLRAAVEAEISDRRNRFYLPLVIVYGRKPGGEDEPAPDA